MERRFILFLVLALAIPMGHATLMHWWNPPVEQPGVAARDGNEEDGIGEDGDRIQEPGVQEPGAEPEPGQQDEPPVEEPTAEPAEPADVPGDVVPEIGPAEQPGDEQPILRQWPTLGSADPTDPYRMVVTLDSQGASVVRIELNSPRSRDLEDRSGYLGHLVIDEAEAEKLSSGSGCLVQVVPPGTPADKVGLLAGDLIVAVGKEQVTGVKTFRRALGRTKPKQQVELTVSRDGRTSILPVTLTRRPLEVIRPEPGANDPSSFLLTLQQIDGKLIARDDQGDDEEEDRVAVGKEIEGLDLWTGNWEVLDPDKDPNQVAFRRLLPETGLEITKTYRLEPIPAEKMADADYPAYHLVFDVRIRNTGDKPHQVAYQLDGANGLPTEGAWYANKIGREWGGVGLRDVVVSFDGATPSLIGCPAIAKNDVPAPWQDDQPLTYIGSDGQYFSVVLIPQKKDPADIWFGRSQTLRVGAVDDDRRNLTNTSCRVVSQVHELARDETIDHRYEIFVGPKKPDLLVHYDLGELVYYGWFGKVAVPIAWLLHVFYSIVGNYGVAILMLTVAVRGAMFPLSRKQALGAQKMQMLQPEIKKIQEKYKKDVEGRTKAQQELFRKHNYNPLSGCLVMFVQLPIFIALYRSLMVDIELRQAPLISESIRWCSNLAGPDMLFDWTGFMPEWITDGVGIFGLGPYFNILPIVTVVLFLLQQKMFMPPPADEQAAMQQKIMKYMMLFMGLLFFKVASGLCMYFIASSLWGLAERQFLPKMAPVSSAPKTRADVKSAAAADRRDSSTGRNGSGGKRQKKSRGKR
ncbi:MAG: YidC/Oxa1 family insertase periplasmic-domain containing protein [Thermoguttaceae bacterium]